MAATLPVVAIIGRPNVGKSTLFNRLVGKKLALVDDRPGVTRDRREGDAELLGLNFRIIDTAGFEEDDPQTLPGRMRAQTEAAVNSADVALFVIDARAGVVPLDEEIGRWLRGSKTPVILLANKAEGRASESGSTTGGASPLSSAHCAAQSHSIMIGRRWMTTLRKLPTIRPINPAARASATGSANWDIMPRA